MQYREDLKTLLFLSIGSAILCFLWFSEKTNFYIYFIFIIFSISVSAINHNHAHLPIWKNHILNKVTDYWIIIFQGHPLFLFYPAHNLNHHKYCNTRSDYNHTWKNKNTNDFLGFLAHPFISALTLMKIIPEHLSCLLIDDKNKFYDACFQYIFLIIYLAIAAASDLSKTIFYIVIPYFISLFYLLASNYLQHAHTNENCKYNNSRNFTGLMNFILFNTGYHTVHHLRPNVHWSKLPEAHKKIEHRISQELNQTSLIKYMFNTFILSLFIKKYKSIPLNDSFV